MRIYDGSPRQDFGEVFRAIGAHLDSIVTVTGSLNVDS